MRTVLRYQPLSQRGASLLELMLVLMVTLAILVTIFAAYASARESADVAELREALVEVTAAARSARPTGNYAGFAGANALSSLGRFGPDRLTDTGALRGPNTTTLRVEATPAAVIPAARSAGVTGKTGYFDVVLDNITPELCMAFARAIQTDLLPRIQIGATVYANRLVSPVTEPVPDNLSTPSHCRPGGTRQVTLRITTS